MNPTHVPDLTTVRLDRSRPHGSVHGVIEDGVHFHQDGLPFDAHGRLVADPLTGEQRAIAERKARKAKRLNPRDAEPEAGADPADPDAKRDDGEGAPDEPGDVNLEAWLSGDAKYLFDAVRTAIRARYDKDCKSIADAVDFLVFEEKLVDRKSVAKRLMPK